MRKIGGGIIGVVLGIALALGATMPGAASAAEPSEYELKVSASALKAGQDGKIEVLVTPAAAWHWNKDFPARLELVVPGLAVTKPTLKQAEGDFDAGAAATGKRAVVTGRFAVKPAQKGPLSGTLKGKFGLCDDKVCIIKKVELPVSLTAQ